MYKNIWLSVIAIFCSLTSLEQLPIYLDDFGVKFTPEKCVDTMYFKNVNKKKRTLLVLYLKDCKGELSFSFFRGKELITTGSYKATSDTLKQYSFGKIKNRINDTILYTTQIISYYKPIKDGLWKYYKNKLVNSFYYKEFVPRRKW